MTRSFSTTASGVHARQLRACGTPFSTAARLRLKTRSGLLQPVRCLVSSQPIDPHFKASTCPHSQGVPAGAGASCRLLAACLCQPRRSARPERPDRYGPHCPARSTALGFRRRRVGGGDEIGGWNAGIEPFSLLDPLAAATQHIGLIGTASTTFSDPYNLARMFASLDHLSRGRAAWNIVTTSNLAAAENFSTETLSHADRYMRNGVRRGRDRTVGLHGG